MGLFDKLKTVFKKEDKSVNTYEKGLSKTRKSFVNKLANLSKEYSEINDNYFEELEDVLKKKFKCPVLSFADIVYKIW